MGSCQSSNTGNLDAVALEEPTIAATEALTPANPSTLEVPLSQPLATEASPNSNKRTQQKVAWDPSMQRLLLDSAKFGNVEQVRHCLASGAIDVNGRGYGFSSFTALHWASKVGHVEIVKLLLAAPAINANHVDDDGYPPLYYACKKGHEAVIRQLLDCPDIIVSYTSQLYRETPLSVALRRRKMSVVDLLVVFMLQKTLLVDIKDVLAEVRHLPGVTRELSRSWYHRRAYLSLLTGCPQAEGHIPQYLFNDLVRREICEYLHDENDSLKT